MNKTTNKFFLETRGRSVRLVLGNEGRRRAPAHWLRERRGHKTPDQNRAERPGPENGSVKIKLAA